MFRMALLLALSLSLPEIVKAAECNEEQLIVATTPVVEQNPGRLVRARQQERLQVSDPSLVIMGDSIAENWIKFASRDFAGERVQNFGVGGDKAQELLWRLENLLPRPMAPRSVVIIVGTNNLTDRSASSCGVAAGVMAVATKVRKLWPNASVFVLPILPRGDDFRFRNEDRRKTNDELRRDLATMNGAFLVDIPEELLTCNWTSQNCGNFNSDLLHPTGDGYKILAQAIKKAGGSIFGSQNLR